MGMVMPPSMKAIIGITTSPTFRSNSTPSVVQWRTTTSWGMWYFSLNDSIKAGVFTRRSNLPIVSLRSEEWLAEKVVEVRRAKLTWGRVRIDLPVSGGSLKSLSCEGVVNAEIRTLWNCNLWWEVKRVTSEGFYSWSEKRRHNPAQILKVRPEPLD